MTEQIQRIKDKLAKLQNDGWEKYKDNCGDWFHNFQMNPPLSQEQLVAFETHFDIDLPESYRDFLLEIGNGGVGPYYGILPLIRWDDEFDTYGNSSLEKTLGHAKITPIDFFSEECTEHANSATGYGLEYQKGPTSTKGTIIISDQGCQSRCYLVITGVERGRVFYLGDMYMPYFMPDPDFLSWYERWLDETLRGKQIRCFGGYGWPEVDRPEYWKTWRQIAQHEDWEQLSFDL